MADLTWLAWLCVWHALMFGAAFVISYIPSVKESK